MTARNDPLARVQAMVDAWGETQVFDTFDTTTPEVSPPNHLENCGFGHFRQFRHQETEPLGAEDRSALITAHEAYAPEVASRVVSHSSGVESVERAKKYNEDSSLIFDTSSVRVSKNGGQVSKEARQAAFEAPCAAVTAPAGVPAEWVQGVARLAGMPCPARFPSSKWAQLATDAAAFLEEWAAAAHRLGWPTWELFGCHRRAPWGRIQGMGLVLLLQGNAVCALTETQTAIRTSTGAHQTYRRKPTDPLHPAERCLVWELDAADGTPCSTLRHPDRNTAHDGTAK